MAIVHIAPTLCPSCGELIIVSTGDDGRVLVPEHPDRLWPMMRCTEDSRLMSVHSFGS
jgi:hypothetical protein